VVESDQPPCSVQPPKINPRGSVAPSRAISDWLTERIKNGDFDPAGEVRLPSEFDLVELFAVNRSTVRKAMGHLRDAGLTRTAGALGTFTVQDWKRRKSRRQKAEEYVRKLLAEQGDVEPHISQVIADLRSET
jgi:DNA-binding GntR family transcriptional regulator